MGEYVRLSELINERFTVEEAYGYKWKKWDSKSNTMQVSDKFEKGYSKKYSLKTDKGGLEIGSGQLGTLLEATYIKGVANLIGKTFEVKSNGKSGLDVRYYFNLVKVEQQPLVKDVVAEVNEDEPISLDDIPF